MKFKPVININKLTAVLSARFYDNYLLESRLDEEHTRLVVGNLFQHQ